MPRQRIIPTLVLIIRRRLTLSLAKLRDLVVHLIHLLDFFITQFFVTASILVLRLAAAYYHWPVKFVLGFLRMVIVILVGF